MLTAEWPPLPSLLSGVRFPWTGRGHPVTRLHSQCDAGPAHRVREFSHRLAGRFLRVPFHLSPSRLPASVASIVRFHFIAVVPHWLCPSGRSWSRTALSVGPCGIDGTCTSTPSRTVSAGQRAGAMGGAGTELELIQAEGAAWGVASAPDVGCRVCDATVSVSGSLSEGCSVASRVT